MQPQLTSNIRSVVVAGDVATVVNDWQLSGTAPDGYPSFTAAITGLGRHRRRATNTPGGTPRHATPLGL
jgi:ketosteroid isomerase-like protein